MRNIELKAWAADLDAVRKIAQKIATEQLGARQQVDTYFHCRQGRLKLRQMDGPSGQLIWYARPDQPGPKASEYVLVPISDPEALKVALTAALGVRCIVHKRREVFLYHNVRIHLDEVRGLGNFLEFEAVLGPEVDEVTGRSQLDALAEEFAVGKGDLASGSYADMLT